MACLLALLAFTLGLAAESSAISQTRKDINALQESVAQLEQEVSELKEAIKKLPSEATIDLIRKNQVNLTTQMAELLREVQVLTGRFDESRFYVDKFLKDTSDELDTLRQRVDSVSAGLSRAEAQGLIKKIDSVNAEMSDIRQRLASLEAGLAGAAAAAPAAGTPEGPPAKAGPSPEEAYESALNVYKEKRYAEARALMGDFIARYPTHKLAGNAQYWIAETYYAEKDFDDAILSYEDLLQKYKNHGKVPAALLKQAFAFMELGDRKAARGILRELIEKHPDSEQTTLAREKLATLEAEEKPEIKTR